MGDECELPISIALPVPSSYVILLSLSKAPIIYKQLMPWSFLQYSNLFSKFLNELNLFDLVSFKSHKTS